MRPRSGGRSRWADGEHRQDPDPPSFRAGPADAPWRPTRRWS